MRAQRRIACRRATMLISCAHTRRAALFLLAIWPHDARACCTAAKEAFIRKYNLTTTALATNAGAGSINMDRRRHIASAMSFVPRDLFHDPSALRLEFGVRNGGMMNFMSTVKLHSSGSAAATLRWDGFDSFQGMPKESSSEAGGLGWTAGKYAVTKLPIVPAHVHLHKGWFNDTLPRFLDSPAGSGVVAFAHLDADIYSSTFTVLDALAARCRLRVGTTLAFDEIFGPPAIQLQEMRALKETAAAYGLEWRFITYLNHPKSQFGRAAVQLTAVRACGCETRRLGPCPRFRHMQV